MGHSTYLHDKPIRARFPTNHRTVREETSRRYSSLYYPHSLLAFCMARCPDLRSFFVRLSWHAQTDMLQATLYTMRTIMMMHTNVYSWESQSQPVDVPVHIATVEQSVDTTLGMVADHSIDLLVREHVWVLTEAKHDMDHSHLPPVAFRPHGVQPSFGSSTSPVVCDTDKTSTMARNRTCPQSYHRWGDTQSVSLPVRRMQIVREK